MLADSEVCCHVSWLTASQCFAVVSHEQRSVGENNSCSIWCCRALQALQTVLQASLYVAEELSKGCTFLSTENVMLERIDVTAQKQKLHSR